MPTTPTYGLPYPALSDPPDGPGQMQALAEAVDTTIASTDTNIANLDSRVTALEMWPAAKYVKTTSQAFTAFSLTDFTFDSADYSHADVTADGTLTTFTLNRAGLWIIHAKTVFPDGSPSGGSMDLFRLINSAATVTYDDDSRPVADQRMRIAVEARFSVGDSLKLQVNGQRTAGYSIGSGFISFRWVAP